MPIAVNCALKLAAPTEAERDAWVAAIRRVRRRAAFESAGGGDAAGDAAAAPDDPTAVAAAPPAAVDKHGAPDGDGALDDGGGRDGEGQEEGAAGDGSEYVFGDWAQYDDGSGSGATFWYNSATGESTWETPPGLEAAGYGGGYAAADAYDGDDAHGGGGDPAASDDTAAPPDAHGGGGDPAASDNAAAPPAGCGFESAARLDPLASVCVTVTSEWPIRPSS